MGNGLARSNIGDALYGTLAGPEGTIGLIYQARQHGEAAFTEGERAQFKRFAAHITMPLHKARYQDDLEHLAFTDPMTGLSNFRYLERRLIEEINRSKRYDQPLSVLLLDIDYFKRFNDTYGHRAGDQVLNQFGAVLKRTLRESDLPARYGGEEFIVICPGIGVHEAAIVAERLRQAVELTPFTLAESLDEATAIVHVTVSIGIATFPINADEHEMLVREADRALYTAKQGGRNRVFQTSVLQPGLGRWTYAGQDAGRTASK